MDALQKNIIFCGLGLSLLTTTNLHAKEVENFYINGINNTEIESRESARQMSLAFTQKYGQKISNTSVSSIYNESQGLGMDIIESSLQKTDLDKLLEGLSKFGLITSTEIFNITSSFSNQTEKEAFVKTVRRSLLLSNDAYRNELYESIKHIKGDPLTGPGSTTDTIPNEQDIRVFDHFSFLLDLGLSTTELYYLNSVNSIADNFNNITLKLQKAFTYTDYRKTQEYKTQEKIRKILDPILDKGLAVNIISHSQGNFFANEAINNINQPDNTRLLSIASPSGELPNTGDFINLREDMVVRLFHRSNLGWNYTNFPDTLWTDPSKSEVISANFIINESALAISNKVINNDKIGHNFVTAYLKHGSRTREKIIDTFAEHYIELGGELLQISNSSECKLLLSSIITDSTEQYEALFYGNKCVYFKEKSFIIEYNLSTKDTQYLYEGNLRYPEYQSELNYVTNISISKNNQPWRQGYGLTLNLQGNVGLTQDDLCPTGQDSCLAVNTFTTPQQCENLWEALTGVLPNAVNKVASISENGVCKYANPTEENVIVYDSNKGETKRYAGTDYYSIFPEDLDDNKLYTILDKNSYLYSNKADAFPYKCEVFLNKVFPEGIPKYIISYEGAAQPCFYTISKGFLIRTHPNRVSKASLRNGSTAICNDKLYKKLNELFPNPDVSNSNILNDMFYQALDGLLSEETHYCSSRSILYRYGIKDGIWYNTYGYIFK